MRIKRLNKINKKRYKQLTKWIIKKHLASPIKQIKKYFPNAEGDYYIVAYKKIQGKFRYALFIDRHQISDEKPEERENTPLYNYLRQLKKKYTAIERKSVNPNHPVYSRNILTF